MSKFPIETYNKELIELIPSIEDSALTCLKRFKDLHSSDLETIKSHTNLVSQVFQLIQGKWTLEIYYTLLVIGKCSFGELKRALPKKDNKKINSRSLTDRLRLLERWKLVSRTIKKDRPIKVFYELTETGIRGFTLLMPFLTYFLLPIRKRRNFKEYYEKFKKS